jgi:hypothetical protein
MVRVLTQSYNLGGMGQAWRACVNVVIAHRDLVIAGIFAIVAAIIIAALGIDSVIHAGRRHLWNKWSESSVSRLQTRILELQTYRDSIQAYASSDRALYLTTFRLVMGILMFGCLGVIVLIIALFV